MPKSFQELSEKEILALAISLEEEEINRKTDISVLFSEEKQNGTKTVVGLNFRIRRNLASR